MNKRIFRGRSLWFVAALMVFLFSINSSSAATALASRLKGYILLQVEENGEAWYVIPTEQKIVYLQNGAVAYQVMRELSLGITDANLAKIPVGIEARFNDLDTDNDGLADRLEEGLGTDLKKADTDNDGFSDGEEIKNNYNPLNNQGLNYDQALVDRLRGYILLQVEKQGQAWYLNPSDGKRYYMQDGPAAYNIMRFLSLGITNKDLNLITKSERTFDVNTTPPANSNDNQDNNNSTSTPPSTPPNTPPGGGGGGGGGSTPPSTPPTADTTAPTVPTNLSAVVSGTQIALSWTASTDAVGVTGYNILRSTTNGGPYSSLTTAATNSYINTGLTVGTTYYYVVQAYDAIGNTSVSSSQTSGTINSSAPICEATGTADCYYISPSGSDLNNGSISAPFASTNPIINSINPGDYIYFRGGSYGPTAKGQIYESGYPPYFPTVAYITRSGTAGQPITFKAYPGETPVLDMYNINPEFNQNLASDPISSPVHSPDNAFFIRNADYIVISGFEIVHGSVYVLSSDYTWVENNHIHDLLSDRDNNGLVILYFTEHAYVRNNDLHDTYQRSIADGSGGWMVNNIKSHVDAQHNGCITTLSGDIYVGYGHESSGPFEFTNNNIHDCPVHLFIKNPQGQLVNANGINLLIKDNYFYGAGRLADYFNASNVLVENNLFKGINGIGGMGGEEQTGGQIMLNEIYARNITFQNNVFSSATTLVRMPGQGFRVANGIYSTAMEDKLKFHNNVVIIEEASTPGSFGWNQGGYVFGNSYATMIDAQHSPSKTLSRIDSTNNCYINQQGNNLAFLKHWYNGYAAITGYSHATARSVYGINGEGDLLPTDTSLTTHFTDPNNNDFSIKSGSACAAISNVGLSDPSIFIN